MEPRYLLGGPTSPVRVVPPVPTPAHEGTYEGKTAAQWLVVTDPSRIKYHLLAAQLAQQDGTSIFKGLFDLEGNLVPGSTCIKIKNGVTRGSWAWRIEGDHGHTWFNPSRARSGARRRAFDASKGYRVGQVRRRAHVASIVAKGHARYFIAEVPGSPIEIIDNGDLGLEYQDR